MNKAPKYLHCAHSTIFNSSCNIPYVFRCDVCRNETVKRLVRCYTCIHQPTKIKHHFTQFKFTSYVHHVRKKCASASNVVITVKLRQNVLYNTHDKANDVTSQVSNFVTSSKGKWCEAPSTETFDVKRNAIGRKSSFILIGCIH